MKPQVRFRKLRRIYRKIRRREKSVRDRINAAVRRNGPANSLSMFKIVEPSRARTKTQALVIDPGKLPEIRVTDFVVHDSLEVRYGNVYQDDGLWGVRAFPQDATFFLCWMPGMSLPTIHGFVSENVDVRELAAALKKASVLGLVQISEESALQV